MALTKMTIPGNFPDWCSPECPGWDLTQQAEKGHYEGSKYVWYVPERTLYCKNEYICNYIMAIRKEKS